MKYASLAQMVRQQRSLGNAAAFVSPSGHWSYADFDTETSRIARGLAALGVSQGDAVGVLTRHGAESALLLLGAAKIGAVVAVLNWRLSARELDYVIGLLQPKCLFADQFLAPTLREVPAAAGRAHLTIDSTDDEEGLRSWTARHDGPDPGFEPCLDDIAVRMFSSGTTGRPKAVEITHRSILSHCDAWTEPFGFAPDRTVQLNALPTFHVSGMVGAVWMLCIGGTTICYPQFEPELYLEAIGRHHATDAFVVPAMLRALVESPALGSVDVSSLRSIVYGGSAIDEALLRRCLREFDCDFRQVYGMTESAGAITLLGPEDHRQAVTDAKLLQSVGKPGPHIEIKIVDPASRAQCEDGALGELWVRSPQTMAGYYGDPEATAALFPEGRAAGWYRTGDAGYQREGYVYLQDRIKDMIITGGENVYPAEVERLLAGHPAVAEVAVIGVPDLKWGEAVKACVVLRPGKMIADSELIAYARRELAHYKCPSSVDFVASLPRNSSGKVLKMDLRKPYWAGRGRNIA